MQISSNGLDCARRTPFLRNFAEFDLVC